MEGKEIKYEIYSKDKPYNLQSGEFNASHVMEVVNYHLQKYMVLQDAIIEQNGTLKIDISRCENPESEKCIHFESGLHGLNKELSDRIIALNLFELQGNV